MITNAGDRGRPTERRRRIEALYHAMMERPPNGRAAALAAECADDTAMQAEVQQLLDREESAACFLATPALDGAGPVVSPASALLTGRRFGPYEIVAARRRHGRGRARVPRLRRDVALKLLAGHVADDPHVVVDSSTKPCGRLQSSQHRLSTTSAWQRAPFIVGAARRKRAAPRDRARAARDKRLLELAADDCGCGRA